GTELEQHPEATDDGEPLPWLVEDHSGRGVSRHGQRGVIPLVVTGETTVGIEKLPERRLRTHDEQDGNEEQQLDHSQWLSVSIADGTGAGCARSLCANCASKRALAPRPISRHRRLSGYGRGFRGYARPTPFKRKGPAEARPLVVGRRASTPIARPGFARGIRGPRPVCCRRSAARDCTRRAPANRPPRIAPASARRSESRSR